MKALLSHVAGGPETLRIDEVPKPEAQAGQVLVKVAAVSLNYPDALMIEDRYQFRPARPFAPGSELSGTVEAIGPGVTDFALGDRVLAMTGFGALAEYVAVEASRTFRIPDAMGFDIAASFLLTYGTNIHGLLDRARLAPGDRLLVLGAAGGIGTSAVELGKVLGAHVVAAVSSEEKAAAARKLGADEVLIYPSGSLDADARRELAGKFKQAAQGGFDVVYDPVGGDYAEPALRAIGWEGRYAVVGFTAGIPKIALNLALLKACSIVGVFWGSWTDRNHARFAEEVAMLMSFWEDGKISPLISERLPFRNAADAIARMGQRGALGKMVIEFDDLA